MQAGETWARERATRDELTRLSLFGEIFRDMDHANWVARLRLLFNFDQVDPDNLEDAMERGSYYLVAAVSAARLIGSGRSSDDASALAYWRNIAGESFGVVATPTLVTSFLRGAISVAWEKNTITWESLRSGDPGPGRAPRKVGSARNRRSTDPDATDDE